ncbi:MAG TPA: GxxExxY protein [Fluviicola sp.]|nr:GxxExxY protein [Fluviicola sp.]
MTENEISYIVRGAVFDVYRELGPGLLESAYESALYFELLNAGLKVKKQLALPLVYKDIQLDCGYRIDLLVEGKVIIELKSIEYILPVHHKQLLTYMKLTGIKLGLLINFNESNIQNGIFRKVLGL